MVASATEVSADRQGLLQIGRRWLIAVHRWIGVGSALLFVMWFASGLVMLYQPMPELTPRERGGGGRADRLGARPPHAPGRPGQGLRP